MKKVFIVVMLCVVICRANAQELLVPLNDDYEMSLQSAAYNSSYRFHTAMKSWSEYQFNGIIDIDSLNESQYWNVDFNKKWKKMIWDSFINKDFIRVKGDDFYFAVNPIIDFEIGKDDDKSIWVNTRGAEVKEYICEPMCDYQKRARIGSCGIYNHEAPRLSKENQERLKYIKPGGNWTDIPDELLPKGMKRARKSDHTKRYGRVTPDGLASTILTKCDPHWGAYFHYNQDRSFTVREAARLQSFPDHFIFTGTQGQQFAQVGNAVPPLLAEAVGLALKSILEEGS